jgi:hypothetical protein
MTANIDLQFVARGSGVARFVTRSAAHAHLLACFRSEQMNATQLLAHMADDPAFARYVRDDAGLHVEVLT